MTDTTTQPATAPANSGGATATLEAPAATSQPSQPSKSEQDQLAYDNAMARAGRQKPADTASPQQAKPEIDPREASDDAAKEGQQPEPFKAPLTDKAKKYMTELGVAEDGVFDTALAAYERYTGHTEAQLQKLLDEDPASFVEAGLKLAKIQKDNASFTAEHHRVLEELKTLKQGVQQPAQPAAAPPVPLAEEVKASITQLIEAIPEGELVDGDKFREVIGIGLTTVADKIAATAQANVQQMQAAYETKLEQQTQELNGMAMYLHDLQLSQARTRLASKYPQITDEKVFASVRKHYDALANGGEYTIDSALEAAAAAELGDESQTKIRDRLLKNHLTRKAVQPRLPSPLQPKHVVPPTKEDQDALAYAKAMEKNYGKQWASR